MMTIEDCREFYAREIQFVANLTTPGLIEAFAKVPREEFLGPGPWQIGSAEARAVSLAGLLQLLKSVRRDAHEAGETCVVHRPDVCLSLAAPK